MKYNKGFGAVAVLIAVVAALAVGGVAYYAGKTSQDIKKVEKSIPAENPTVNNAENNPAQNLPVNNNVASDCIPTTASWIKVLSPNGGETYTAGQQIEVKWKSCNVTPPISLILIKHNPSVSYAQSERSDDYAGFSLGGFDGNIGTPDDGIQRVTLPSSSDINLISGQHYFFIVAGQDNPSFGLGFNPRDVSDGLFTINSATNSANLITKSDWGVSFNKASDWDVVTNTSSEISLKQNIGQEKGDVIKITYISGQSITDTDAKFGNITYYYDGNSNRWMKTTNENGIETSAATTSSYTVDNLPIFSGTGRWKTYIIPTSHTTFIKLNIGGSGWSQPLTDLVKTIKKI